MEPHDSHELALNRAFEERWQRRMERPRSVAALTALQYRERKKYELAWYKNETIQLSEQIEHLQNRLSFLMDQNTSLNLECQKLRKRVAQLENLCRDQLKNLVSRPSKSATSSPGNSEIPSSSSVSGTVVIPDVRNRSTEDQSEDEADPDESEESSPTIPPGTDVPESANTMNTKSGGMKSLTSTTATVRRGIPIVKQRSPSGKTTIVAAAATTSGALHQSGKHSSNRNLSYISVSGNSESILQVSQSDKNVGEHDYVPRKRILIPKRAISSTNDGSKTLRIVRPLSSMSGKSVPRVNSDVNEPGSSQNKSPGNMHVKRLSHNSFSKHSSKSEYERRRKERPSSPAKTPPEVIISDVESSDIESHEKHTKSHVSLPSQAIGTKQSVRSNLSKRAHKLDDKPPVAGKRPKSSDDATAT